MVRGETMYKVAALGVVCLLAGCIAPPPRVQVKDVLADQSGFLQTNFSADKLPPAVRSAITSADNAPLGFQRMDLKLTWTWKESNKASAENSDQQMTVINAGGSFVQELTQNSRNGIPVNQRDRLGYRGIFPLLSQDFSMNARSGGLTFVVRDISHFDALTPSATKLAFDYNLGFVGSSVKPSPHRLSCNIGAPYPATRVFVAFQGNARDLDCESYNGYGALAGKSTYVYLQQYGVALELHYAGATMLGDGKIVAATIK